MELPLQEDFTSGIDFTIEQLERRISIWRSNGDYDKRDEAERIIRDLKKSKLGCYSLTK